MSKSLNQAFLRAFSKGQASTGPIPAPHVRGMASSHGAPVGAPLAADSGEWRRVEEQAGTKADTNSIPAPHLPVAQLAEQNHAADHAPASVPNAEFEPQETLIGGQLGAVSMLFGDAALVINPPGPLDTALWNAAGHREVSPSPPVAERTGETETRGTRPLSAAEVAAHTAAQQQASASRWTAPAGYEHRFDGAAVAPPDARETQPEPPPASVAAEPKAAGTTFTAAWEVDRLGWSDTCNQLYQSEAKYFEQAGRQLGSATGEGLNVLAITSAFRGEGRTTLALLLARCAAAAGVRVALLDADLDNPQLASAVKLQPETDWRSALHDATQLSEAAVHAVEDGITLFPLQSTARGTTLKLSDTAVTALVETLGRNFELVVIDMGPTVSDERRLFAAGEHCPINAAVIVRDLRSTGEIQMQDIVGRLMKLGVEAVGIAENFVRRS